MYRIPEHRPIIMTDFATHSRFSAPLLSLHWEAWSSWSSNVGRVEFHCVISIRKQFVILLGCVTQRNASMIQSLQWSENISVFCSKGELFAFSLIKYNHPLRLQTEYVTKVLHHLTLHGTLYKPSQTESRNPELQNVNVHQSFSMLAVVQTKQRKKQDRSVKMSFLKLSGFAERFLPGECNPFCQSTAGFAVSFPFFYEIISRKSNYTCLRAKR